MILVNYMEKLKICQICKKNIAYYNCKLCGKHVCANCYNNGLCQNCKISRI